MINLQRAGPILGGGLGFQHPTDTWSASKITQSQRLEVERGLSCCLCLLPPSRSPTSTTTTFPAHLWQHIYLYPLLPSEWIQVQVIFLLQNWKGMLEEHKSREKENRLINKIRANKKAAHMVCSLRKEVGWGACWIPDTWVWVFTCIFLFLDSSLALSG